MGIEASQGPSKCQYLETIRLQLYVCVCVCVSCSVVSDSVTPTDCSPPGSSVRGILQARILEWVAISSPGDLPNPGIEPGSPTLQADSLPAEPPGKFKNPRVPSLSLLQQIFPTKKSNWGLLHCRWILYQLSYQGSPLYRKQISKTHSCHQQSQPINQKKYFQLASQTNGSSF